MSKMKMVPRKKDKLTNFRVSTFTKMLMWSYTAVPTFSVIVCVVPALRWVTLLTSLALAGPPLKIAGTVLGRDRLVLLGTT